MQSNSSNSFVAVLIDCFAFYSTASAFANHIQYLDYIPCMTLYLHVHCACSPASLVLADTSGEVGPNPISVLALIVNR